MTKRIRRIKICNVINRQPWLLYSKSVSPIFNCCHFHRSEMLKSSRESASLGGRKEIIRNCMHNKYCMPYRYMNINCVWPHNCDGFIRMLMFTYDMRNEINQNASTQSNKITLTPIYSIFYFGTVFVFEGELSVISKFRLISCCLVDVSTYRWTNVLLYKVLDHCHDLGV